jgi:3-deoxy-manno-octulosonate cytidylyltransferase (CMP-KDO synthetase)
MGETGVMIVIPARWASSRFPGKPLARIGGRSVIERVYRRAQAARRADRVVVATDDDRIREHVEGFGGEVVMTRADHRTGTDRVAEVAAGTDHEIVVNVQGDEPALDPLAVDALIDFVAGRVEVAIATLGHSCRDRMLLESRDVVKVEPDSLGRALRFTREPSGSVAGGTYLRHVGIYAFRREALLRFAGTPSSPGEIREGLEQLRALENGMPVHLLETSYVSHGIDRPSDLKTVEKLLNET